MQHTRGPICPETLGSSDLPLVAEAAGTGPYSQANHQVSCSPGGRATREKELSKPHGLYRTRNHATEGKQESGGLATTLLMILVEKSSDLEEGSSYNEAHFKTVVNL